MKKTVLTAAILLLTSAVSHAASDMADMVDMFMGVRGNSNCVIGPQLPHGSVNPSPATTKATLYAASASYMCPE